jgi:hypothetical protein
MRFIGVKKTYRAALQRSINQMSQGVNASMKKAPPIETGGAFFYIVRRPYSAFASGAFSPWDRL